ncbi:MAG: hypothetical protein UX57_C0007G0080 [Candidatus Uhrbacteria bacterium GW2011_GWE2_46_68]|uniref:Uncharacterized protein n=2 Tax=Candidatus Uhriibacteriota TaxID=1752732 RepID=A0A0G1SG49_9BACT|nr:MAG: hypothetical protein UX45_C0004G0040 [Candidatus Uhrbacteria bacterium GW2011_GWF2_46_218]KKU41048.1 MAG: hypothetical protein UX57_C0007G0080 [Candidatus Uhrbacteria bacterium GW2011_GWE2_46_68]
MRPTLESAPSAVLHETVLNSVSSVRKSIPEQYRAHFETLRQEIIAFAETHGIPRASLTKLDALREAAQKLSTPDLKHFVYILESFGYLLAHHEPDKNRLPEHLEEIESLYNLRRQYTDQVAILEQTRILKNGVIDGIGGWQFPLPTLEQIAQKIYEQQEMLGAKYAQGFTKLLLVPFGMSLDVLILTFKQFLLSYKKKHPNFLLNTTDPLSVFEEYRGADRSDDTKLVYYPASVDESYYPDHTKTAILKKQLNDPQALPGWTVHLLQPSDPSDPHSPGIAPIPKTEEAYEFGKNVLRPDLKTNQNARDYLAILEKAKDDPDSPYYRESGFAPEDWMFAFMTHLIETGKPLDENAAIQLIGAYFLRSNAVPGAFWSPQEQKIKLVALSPQKKNLLYGARTSIIL